MMSEPIYSHWLTLHSLIVMLGLAVYVIASHTLHQRRHPSAAIALVISLVLLPYVALPLYLIFNSRKLASLRPKARRHSFTTLDSNPDALTTRTQQLAAIMALPPAVTYHQLNIHEDGHMHCKRCEI